MPYEYAVDHTSRTIQVRGYGHGTTEDTLRLIESLHDTLREWAGYDFLYDAVELHVESSPSDMIRVAAALFGEAGARFRRCALVVPSARIPLARIFAALAHPWGVTANVFRDVESAREWLAEPQR